VYLLGCCGLDPDRQKGCGLLRASVEQGMEEAHELYNNACVAEKANIPQDEMEKRLQDILEQWFTKAGKQ
jgi:hypothetical protein